MQNETSGHAVEGVGQETGIAATGVMDEVANCFGPAPWWIVSGAFHGLLLLLVTLISLAVVSTVTEDPLVHVEVIKKADPPPPPPIKDRHIVQTPMTDPDLPPVLVPVYLPPEDLVPEPAQTNDRIDSQSTRGDQDQTISDANMSGLWNRAVIGPGRGGPSGGLTGRIGGNKEKMTGRYRGRGTLPVVELALAWLARNQEADGHWDTAKFGAEVKTDTACTGFALLAFLGAGHTEKVGNYRETVRRAVAWLKSKQNSQGLVFDETDAGAHRGIGYPHAIAGMALAEAAGMGSIPDTVRAAQKAVDYSVKIHQSGSGYDRRGFRYQAGQAGDLSVTGWYVMQLKAAKTAGLNVDMLSFEGVLRFLDSVERKGAGGETGYGMASIYSYQPENEHAHSAHRLTAIGTLCRQFMACKKEALEPTVRWMVGKGGLPDNWGEGKTDLYYWYYGTLCTFQQGGETWNAWNEAMKRTFIDNQRKGGAEDGSWDPVGDYSKEWGRVGQTALSTLCLEVYYRYLRMYRD